MTLSFNIDYRTEWGQELRISGSCKALGCFNEDKSIPMVYVGNGAWSLSVEPDADEEISYCYLLFRNGKVIRKEYGKPHRVKLSDGYTLTKVFDSWQEMPSEKTFLSAPFTKIIYNHTDTPTPGSKLSRCLTIKVMAPMVMPEHRIGIIGKSKGLGGWNPDKVVPMRCPNFPEWEADIDASKVALPLEYKFVITDKDNQIVLWESDENRHVFLPPFISNERMVVSGQTFRNPLPRWRGAGVAIPVFSLRSEQSFGIGEFSDLMLLADWADTTGLRFIQILPVNDTTITKTWVDTYPYKSISIFAMNPIYLNPDKLGTLRSDEDAARFRKIKEELNALPEVDYERVFEYKWEYFKLIFDQEGKELMASKEFKDFFAREKGWLEPYAAFCYLRDKYATPDFTRWGKFAKYDPEVAAKLGKKGTSSYQSIALSYFLQFHLHKQLSEAVAYAHNKGVAIKGDIPIGISRHSTDAWVEPQLFNMNGQAGAPPDDFSANGQNWGFPTYCWEEMEKDGFSWWKNRFSKMADYYDAYRIDHILGFFRIWEIPLHSVQGLLGYFNPALPLSREEVHNFGLHFNDDRFLKPFIRHHFLLDFFGEYADEATNSFLTDKGFGIYDLKADFDTQRKVENYFEGKIDAKSTKLKEGLFGLINEVLFIRDKKQEYCFHPRIAAQFTRSYLHLNDHEKAAFDRLYNHFYYERHTEFWKHEAMKKLPALSAATDMLVCGEDLGMIPDSVPEVMHQLQILSLEIQRMPKDPKITFGSTSSYPYSSVCTTSTHDMSTIRGWWEEDREKTQKFFNEVLHEHGEAPFFCEPWICERIVDMHLASPSILCILPLQDWLSIDKKLRRANPSDERINIPSNPFHYWRYRMHITLEQLNGAQELNSKLKEMVVNHKRS